MIFPLPFFGRLDLGTLETTVVTRGAQTEGKNRRSNFSTQWKKTGSADVSGCNFSHRAANMRKTKVFLTICAVVLPINISVEGQFQQGKPFFALFLIFSRLD